MKVAIDGPAGSGKSTVAHALAERMDFSMLDTGAMYRSVTLACLEGEVDLEDDEAVSEVARRIRIEFAVGEDASQRIVLDGRDVSEAIRTPEVDASVSRVAAIPAVREAMVAEQRRLAEEGDVVAEGRDIGTVVFPDAEVKVFLTADAESRAHRRAEQRSVADPEEEKRILESIMKRDEADSSRETAPLCAADDAHLMDNSSMTVEEEVAQISAWIEEARTSGVDVAENSEVMQKCDPAEAAEKSEPAAVAENSEPAEAAEKTAAQVVATTEPETVTAAEETMTAAEEADNSATSEKTVAEAEVEVEHEAKPEVDKTEGEVEVEISADDAQPAQADAKQGGVRRLGGKLLGATQAGAKRLGDKFKKRGQAKKAEDEDAATDGRMKQFARHEPEEFYEHSERDYPLSTRALLGTTIWACGGLSKLLWNWSVENGERLWKADTGRVVVMNHVSMLDPVVIVVSDWFHGRRMRPIYKSEFDGNDFVKWFFARVGAIPVERGTADIKAVRRAQRALQRGEDVLVFPEGTRVYSDDQDVTIHGGFALMAQLAKVPVLPVAIVGARDGAPGGNKPLRPGRVWMKVGEPITFDQIEEKGRKQRAKAMEKLAMDRVYELREELRAEHPGKM